MDQPPPMTPGERCVAALTAGFLGAFVGFIVGFLCFAAFIPFATGEGAKWLPGIAVLTGIGGAMFGAPLGAIAGAIAGVTEAFRAAFTKGALGFPIGGVAGFFVGILLSGLVDHDWAIFSDGSTSGVLLGGGLGVFMGTILGAVEAARRKAVPLASDSDQFKAGPP